MKTVYLSILISAALCLNNGCSKKSATSETTIVHGESIGVWRLGMEVPSQITEDGVYVYTDATKKVFAIYTENPKYKIIDGSFQIGSTLREVQEVHGVGAVNNHDAQLIGKKLVVFEGFFVGVEDDVVKGIGVGE